MKKLSFSISIIAIVLSACSSQQQIAQELEKNPDLVFDVLKKNPDKFISALREAAQAEQMRERQAMQKERSQQMEKDLKNPRAIKIDDQRLIFGAASAPIVIVKYADFQCPACRIGYKSLEEVKKKYAGRLKVIHKNIPLEMHPQAQLAAEIFETLVLTDKPLAVQFYKTAYEKQNEWQSDEKLWALAKKIGVNKEKVLKEIKKGKVQKNIDEDIQEHEKLGFEGTPAYMINGVALYGAASAKDMSEIIEETLKKK